MSMTYGDYPEQDKPIYAFHVEESGRITKFECPRYAIHKINRNGGLRYRIPMGSLKYPRIAVKDDNQLDRFLSGYVYTFDPDPDHAALIIVRTLKEKMHMLESGLKKTRALYDHVTVMLEVPDGEDMP